MYVCTAEGSHWILCRHPIAGCLHGVHLWGLPVEDMPHTALQLPMSHFPWGILQWREKQVGLSLTCAYCCPWDTTQKPLEYVCRALHWNSERSNPDLWLFRLKLASGNVFQKPSLGFPFILPLPGLDFSCEARKRIIWATLSAKYGKLPYTAQRPVCICPVAK